MCLVAFSAPKDRFVDDLAGYLETHENLLSLSFRLRHNQGGGMTPIQEGGESRE
jgi:hypothetical protein